MSYEIAFRSRELANIIVDNQRGEKLKALWFDADNRNTPIDIEGNAYLISDIKSIVQVAPQVLPNYNLRSLPDGPPKHIATRSIQSEINTIAQKVSGRTGPYNPKGRRWQKLIRDNAWREQTRDKLQSKGEDWCDDKAGTCACTPKFVGAHLPT